jgi:predicted kinase
LKAQEHRALGDAGTGAALVDLGGDGADDQFHLTFGDVVALSGDFFVADGFPVHAPRGEGSDADVLASEGLFTLAATPGDRGARPGTRDEVVAALKVMAADQGLVDRRFEPGGEFGTFDLSPGADETDVERRVRDRFLALGSSNDDHFVAPGRRGPATSDDRPRARFPSAVEAYHRLHERALDEAWQLGRRGGEVSRAMAREAAAQHHLTDAFAAGHLRTPVAAMRELWQQRYPAFWDGLRRKVASDTAEALRELALPLRLVSPNALFSRTLAAVEARTRGYPRISLGDLLAKVFHDWDNAHGLLLEGGGMVFGDGCLDRGLTRELAVAAVRAGGADVEAAFDLGRRRRTVTGSALYGAVREATGAPSDAFVAESKVPTPSPENPPQNWWATDLDELWGSPIVGSTGTTVGEAVEEALQPGEELPRRLECLGRGIDESLAVPPVPGLRRWLARKACQAYRRGFIANLGANPKETVSACIDGLRPDGYSASERRRVGARPGG